METADSRGSTSLGGPSLQHPRNARKGFLWHGGPSRVGELEDSAYAPRRLSSPSIKERLTALWQLCIHFRQLGAVENWGYGGEQNVRDRMNLPSLVQAGRHAGRSRVVYRGKNITIHLWLRDYFISIVQNKTRVLILAFLVIYQVVFWFWGALYYLLVRFDPGCIYGADSFVEAWLFAVVTQLTVGYGNTGPQNCWAVSWMIVVQGILAVLLSSIVVGIMFARISHPHYRGKSIYIGDRAIVARRDGALKLMFRIADVRATQVVEPHVKAFLYTWGAGRVTAEGERIPVRCEPLDIGYIDGMMLLPLIIEHTIDERSPLCGHTHDSLAGLMAEIVITFEGTTEFGNPFMARRSYLPHEIHWGEQFCPIIMKPDPGARDKRYGVDLTHFHQLRRQNDVPAAPRAEASQLVVTRALKTVPYPLLGENTLVLSDSLCLSDAGDGRLELAVRVGDTYPNQMTEITVHMFLYRWRSLEEIAADALLPAFSLDRLDVGYTSGADRLNLRLPLEVTHLIDDASPLAHWRRPGGVEADLGAEIVVLLNAYVTRTSSNMLRQRTYFVGQHVRWGYRFEPMVKPPAFTRQGHLVIVDGKPRVRWGRFHAVAPDARLEVRGAPPQVPGEPCLRLNKQPRQGQETMVRAPESHAPRRAQVSHEQNTAEERRLHAEAARALSQQLAAAVSARAGAGGPEQSDYTVMPMDLQRYATQIASQTLMPARSRRPGLGRLNSLFSHVPSPRDDAQASGSSGVQPAPSRRRHRDAAAQAAVAGHAPASGSEASTPRSVSEVQIMRRSPFAAASPPVASPGSGRPPLPGARDAASASVDIPGSSGAPGRGALDDPASPQDGMMFVVSPDRPSMLPQAFASQPTSSPLVGSASSMNTQPSPALSAQAPRLEPVVDPFDRPAASPPRAPAAARELPVPSRLGRRGAVVGSAAALPSTEPMHGAMSGHARSPSLDAVPEDAELTLHEASGSDLAKRSSNESAVTAAALARQLNKSSSSNWQQNRALKNLFGGEAEGGSETSLEPPGPNSP